MRNTKHLWLVVVFIALSACRHMDHMAFDSGVDLAPLELAGHQFHRRLLANGLQAIAVRDDEKSVSIFMTVAAGKRQEDEQTTGLAHLTEHAMYTGTEDTGPGEHDRRIRKLGGQSNAFTREDYTLFYDHKVPAASLQEVLHMEADRLTNLNFPSDAVYFEREQLRKEEARTWQTSQVIDEQLEHEVYTQHPYRYGLLNKEGHTRAPSLTASSIRKFYRTWYQPERVSVIVAGDIDPQQALDAIEQSFGSLRNTPVDEVVPQEPDISQSRHAELASTLSRDRLEWVWLTPAMGHPDRPALYVLADILSRRTSLTGKALSVDMGRRVDRELFRIIVTDTDDGEEINAALQGLLDDGIQQAELDELKTRVARRYTRQALRARPYLSLAASVGVYAALGHLDSLQAYEKAIMDLSTEQVLAVAKQYLSSDKRVSVLFKGTHLQDTPLPDDTRQLHRIAVEATEQGKLQRAAAAYTELLKRGPDRMNKVIFLASRGQISMQARNYAAAIADFKTALQVVEYPDVRNLLEEAEALQAGLKKTPGPARTEQPDHYAQGEYAATTKSPEAELIEQLEKTTRRLEDWRGLRFKQLINPEFVEPEDNKLAGWYAHEERRLVVVKGRSREFTRGTLVHELHHALQDQHWDLARLQQKAASVDQARALRSLVEGEAMLAVSEILNYDFEQHMKLPAQGALERARFEKIFNYGQGLRFVRALRNQGGWEAVNEIWRSPPQSTAEIYHPERYPLDRQAALASAPEGGKLIKETRLGEFELRWLLASSEQTRHLSDHIGSKLINDRWRLKRHGFFDKREHWQLAFTDSTVAGEFVTDALLAIKNDGWQAEQSGAVVHLWRKAKKQNWFD